MNVLMTAPLPSKKGGVANYCNVLRPRFAANVEYVVRGSRTYRAPGRTGHLGLGMIGRMLRDYAAFARALLQSRCEVVHQNTSLDLDGMLRDTIVILLTKLFRRRLVVFFHGWQDGLAAKMTRPEYAPLRRLYLSADAVVVLAESFKAEVQRWGYTGPVYVETTIVDDASLEGADGAAPSQGVFTVLFLARVEEDKGIYCALDAVRMLSERGHAARLVVAGDGSEREAAEASAARHGLDNVTFLGYVRGAEKTRVLAEADAYLLPTTHGEGMPTTVLEAMAFGLPILTRPVGGLADFLEDGAMGFLTESLDPADYAGLLEELILDPERAAAMRATNRAYARERFLASRVAQRLEAIYADTLTA